MKKIITFLFTTVALLASASAQTHPRLFFDQADIAGFRAKANTAPWSNMLAAMEWNLERDYTSGYDASYPSAHAMAALHLFRDSGAAPADYSEQARLATLYLIFAPDSSGNPIWAVNGYKSLSRAGRALRVSIAYDLCRSAWVGLTMPSSFVAGNGVTYTVTAPYAGMDFNAAISLALKNNADSLVASGGAEWPGDTKIANNWFAVRFSTALLSYLACDEPEAGWSSNYTTCLSKIRAHYNANLTTRADANGWNPEGLAYTQYPGYNSFPMIYALKRLKGIDLTTEIPALKKALWTTYQGVLPIDRFSRSSAAGDTRIGWSKGLRPDFTDDHNSWDPEGTAALAFAFAPEPYKPGMKWMFRRLCGDLGDQTWDCSTGNGLWSLLFYPNDLAEQNPSTAWGNTYADYSYGVFMFRNRYQDANDFVMQTHGNMRQNLGGHSSADGLSFRIYGLGVPWCVGSGRTGDPRGQTNVFQYDPNIITSSGTRLVPSIIDTYLRANGDGYTVMNMDTTEIGVSNQTRRIITDYSGSSGAPGYFIVSDSSNDGTWWRMNTPDFNTITTDSNSFTITSPDGHKLTAKVLWPLNPTFRTGTFNRPPNLFYKNINSAANSLPYTTINKWVDFQGNGDGKFLVAITITENGAPIPNIAAVGTGVTQTITTGTRTVTLDGNSINVNGWTKPTLTIASPADGINYNAGVTSIPVSGTASDPDGVQRVELQLDGVFIANATLDGSGGWSGNVPSVALGQHVIQATAVDTVNDSSASSINVKVNSTQPPLVAVTWPSQATVLQSGQIVQFQGTASDPENALNRVEIWADGGKLGNAVLTGGRWSYSWSGAKTGVHQVIAIAYDNAGDFTQTANLPVTLSVRFSNVTKWGDAANYLVANSFTETQTNLNGSGRWSVVEEDGDLRLKVRPIQNFDYSSYQTWMLGTDVTGKGNWRLSYQFKTGEALADNPENLVFFGAGTDAPMTLDLRPTNGVKRTTHPSQESGTRVWHRISSGPMVGVAWSLNAATYPGIPATDYAGIPNTGWNNVRVDRVGKTLKVYVNNRLILDGDHALLGTKGPIGLGNLRPFGSGGATGFFDDIDLVTLDAAGEPLPDSAATGSFTLPAAEGTGYALGTSLTFGGTVTDVDTPALVEIFLGSEKIGNADLTGSGTTRTWTLPSPWTAVAGVWSLAIRTTDALGNVAWPTSRSFKVDAASNTAPIVTIAQNAAVTAPDFGVNGSVSDADGSVALVQILKNGIPAGNATVTGSTWSYTFTNLATGSYTITARAFDNLSASTDATFIASHDGSAPPTISNIIDQIIPMNTATGAIAFTIGDDATSASSLVLTATSSNPILLPLSGIVFGGSDVSRTLVLTPASGQSGTSTITVTVTDGASKTASAAFLLTVTAPPVATSVVVTPSSATVNLEGIRQFSASLRDQYGQPMGVQPPWSWSVPSAAGTVNATGLFTAAAAEGGPYNLSVTGSSITGTALLTVGSAPTSGWDGDTDTTFSNGSNWVGGTAPLNDLTSEIGLFSGGVTLFQPKLNANRSINGLNFTSSGWVFSASAGTLTVGNGGIDSAGAGSSVVSAPIAVGAAGGFWTISTGSILNLSGILSSSNAFTVIGGGALRLSGTAANTFNGVITVGSGGTIEIDKTDKAAFANASVVVVDGTVKWLQAGVAGNTAKFTVNSGGTVDLNDNSAAFAFSGNEKITLAGGTVQSGVGVWKFTGNNAGDGAQVNGATVSTITGNVDFGGATTERAVRVFDSTAGLDFNLAANIVQGGKFVIKGNGSSSTAEVSLGGDNSGLVGSLVLGTTGNDFVRVYLDHINAAGAPGGANTNTVNAGSSIVLRGGRSYAETASTVIQFNSIPGFCSVSGRNTWAGTITNPGGSSNTPGTIQVDADSLTMTGSLAGFSSTSRQLAKTGAGAFIYDNAANNINGSLYLSGGVFAFKPVGKTTRSSGNTIFNGGTLAGPDDVTMALGSGNTQLRFGGNGGGFAAFGSDIHVDLSGITTLVWGGGTAAQTVTATVSGGVLTGFNGLYFGGGGNSGAEGVTLSGGGGSGASATLAVNAAGVITGLNLINGGSGYTTAPSVTIAPPACDGGTINFLPNSAALILNSSLSQHKVVMLDNIDLAAAATSFSGQREIRVEDNPASDNDFAVIDAAISSSKPGVGILKTGPGLLELAAGRLYSYSGPTMVSSGTLRVNGSITGGSSVTVSGDAILTGIGAITGAVIASGSIAPGNSIGTLASGSVTWNGTSTNAWRYELGSGNTSDLLNITGDFIKGTGTDFLFDLGGTGSAGTYKLVDWTGTTTFIPGNFTYTQLAAGLTGSFQIIGKRLELVVTAGVPASGFAAWQDTAFPSDTPVADRNPGADPDHDGLLNLMEYALGTSPMTSTLAPAAMIVEDGGLRYLEISWIRPNDRHDVAVAGQVSQSLTGLTWSSDPAQVSTSITPQGAGQEKVTIRNLHPIGNPPSGFLRARAIKDP